MIPNTDFFNIIEDYCLGQLNEELRIEFEAELKVNPELRNEVELWKDVQNAITEIEVLNLREKLVNVTSQTKSKATSNDSFELLTDLSEFNEISEVLSSEELINYYESLPKVHVYNHEVTSNENIHQFYKEQNQQTVDEFDEEFDDLDLSEFAGIEDAILEKDILQLRQTLKQVSRSVEPQYSVEQVDEFINGELFGSDLIDFERDYLLSKSLKEEVNLHKEIDSAIQEFDIMNLRKQIAGIIKAETSWNVSEESIENYIDGILEDQLLVEFNAELAENMDLVAEVELRRRINQAIGESDIINLRSKLKETRESVETRKVKMLVPETRTEQIKFWRTSVAIFIVLLGLAGVLRNGFVSVNGTYENYYETPVWSPERSVSNEITLLQKGVIAYNEKNYSTVIRTLNTIHDPVSEFYKAASYQNLGDFTMAIKSYSTVIGQGDNLFIEEAEWYRSLCYLKLRDWKNAREELLAVIDRKGHYEKDAKTIMRRLKGKLN